LRDNLFYSKIMRSPERWRGAQELHPIKYQKGVASVAFSGFDLLPIDQIPTAVNMTFYPSFVATNVALAGTDLSVNEAEGNGSLQTLRLMDVTMTSRAQDAADDIGNFLQGTGTGFGGKAPAGLGNIVDDGTNAATYGGLARATYSGLKAAVTAVAGGNLTLLAIRQNNNTISDGPVAPDMLVTDYNTWALFELLMTPFQRNNYSSYQDMKAGAGYQAQYWGGMEIFRDKKITSGYFYQLNREFIKFHSLKWWKGTSLSTAGKEIVGNVYGDNKYNIPSGFTWTGIIQAYNMGAINGFVIWGGQVICTAPFRNGLLTGIVNAA